MICLMKPSATFAVGVVVLVALTTVTYCDVSIKTKPWIADVNTTANNSCCFGDTNGLRSEISGISPSGKVYHSKENLQDEAGVECSTLDVNYCSTCSMNATLENDGFMLKCALLTKDQSHEVSMDNVTLNVTLNVLLRPTDAQDSSTDAQDSSTSHSNIYMDRLTRVVTPSVLVTAVLFIPAAVFIGYVLYKCYNRQQHGSQTSQQRSLNESQTSESPINERYWETSICCLDSEVERDAARCLQNKEEETTSIFPRQKLQDSGLVRRRPHSTSKNAIPLQSNLLRSRIN